MKRAYHRWELWECYPAGFYEVKPPSGMTKESCRNAYADILGDSERFAAAIDRMFSEWPHSCEQFLTNPNINRLAWIGQASMCVAAGVPATFRAGFFLLSRRQQAKANAVASSKLKEWIEGYKHGREKASRAVHGAVAQGRLFRWNS